MKFKMVHEAVTELNTGSTIEHGRSDIADVRGHTSYLINWGITRIPTLVLFRRGRARIYPWTGPSFQFPTFLAEK